MEEIDIWRTATLLIKQHGVQAGLVTAKRAETLLAQSDHVGVQSGSAFGDRLTH